MDQLDKKYIFNIIDGIKKLRRVFIIDSIGQIIIAFTTLVVVFNLYNRFHYFWAYLIILITTFFLLRSYNYYSKFKNSVLPDKITDSQELALREILSQSPKGLFTKKIKSYYHIDSNFYIDSLDKDNNSVLLLIKNSKEKDKQFELKLDKVIPVKVGDTIHSSFTITKYPYFGEVKSKTKLVFIRNNKTLYYYCFID